MTVQALHTEAAPAVPPPVRKAIPAGQLLIGGRWKNAQAGETMDVTDPTTEASITHVQKASAMNIGIIGAGNVGTGIGRRLAAAGHDVVVSFARSPESLAQAAAMIGGSARAGSVAQAAAHGEVVVLATPWAATLDAVREAGGALDGKVLWDCTNPLLPDMSGLALGTTTSGGEAVAAAAPGARAVKAVPPFAEVLHSPDTAIGGASPGVFVCGDDAAARQLVAGLVVSIGADPVDAGPLQLARYTEPLGMLLVQLAYGQGMGARIGTRLLRDPAGASS